MTDPTRPYGPGQPYPQQQGYGSYPQQGYRDEGPYAPGYYQGDRPPTPPVGYGPVPGYGDGRPPRRKKRRVFLWVFLALQALFLILLIAQLAGHTAPPHSDLVSACYHHHWWPLFKSQQDCVVHYGGALNAAGDLGTGIGAALIIALWVAVDVILGISYGIYRLATRASRAS